MNSTVDTNLPLAKHSVRLVYPFRHVLNDEKGREKRLEFLNCRWEHWWVELAPEERQRALDDTYYFLPHIRETLFPETRAFRSDDPQHQLGDAWAVAKLELPELFRRIGSESVIHLRSKPALLAGAKALTLFRKEIPSGQPQSKPGERRVAEAEFTCADLFLFEQGVGFLVMQFRVADAQVLVGNLTEFLYYARQVHLPRIDWLYPEWEGTKNGQPFRFESRDLVDFLLQGCTCSDIVEELPDVPVRIDDFTHRLRANSNPRRYSATKVAQVYGQYFRLYTYACLESQTPSPNAPTAPEAVARDLGFESLDERVLYELATCSPTTNMTEYQPHASQLKQLRERSRIALWADWQAMALRDNVVFLGLKPSRFNLNALVDNVSQDYFYLYLLAVYQKTRLSLLQGELVRRDSRLFNNLRAARGFWHDFVMFSNHFWFNEVTDRSQGGELYRAFQRGLDTGPLYEAVSREVRDLQLHYEEENRRQTVFVLDLIAFIGVPLTIVVEFFSGSYLSTADISGPTGKNTWMLVRWGLIASIVGLAVLLARGWWLRSKRWKA